MATITATLNVSSSDLTSSSLSLSKTMTMTKDTSATVAGDGLEFTSGLVRRKYTAVTEVDLVPTGAQVYGTPTASKAGKLYIKNTGSSTTDFVSIGLGDATGAEELDDGTSKITLGKLYGGEWMIIPYHGATNVGDVLVKPSTAEATTVEWMLFFE
tara:strand:- start:6676 stop:7143 length:468 start_codon:yes stop_codon:yes gene_type:complete